MPAHHVHRIKGELLICETGEHPTTRVDGRSLPDGPWPPRGSTTRPSAGDNRTMSEQGTNEVLLTIAARVLRIAATSSGAARLSANVAAMHRLRATIGADLARATASAAAIRRLVTTTPHGRTR